MKFGKLEDITEIRFELPEDHPDTHKILVEAARNTDIRMGGTMWNIPAWVGKWYPSGTRSAGFLRSYAQLFPTIELNATHYRTPTVETIRKWADETPESFLFCPKWPQGITHYRRFRNCEAATDQFLEVVHAFGNRLGPCFIQLPSQIGPSAAPALMDYLLVLPEDLHVAVEFRHPDWFTGEHSAAEEIWHLMAERAVTSVISDTAGRRDAVHMRLTSQHAIVRFGGNALHASDYRRLDDWASRVADWSARGLQSFHLWMHQPDSLLSPDTCVLFADAWHRATGRSAVRPVRPDHATLFG